MSRITFLWFVSLLSTSLCYWMPTEANERQTPFDVDRMFDELTESQDGLAEPKPQMANVGFRELVPPYKQKRMCSVGGGMSNACVAANVDQQMKTRERLLSALGPGKRANFRTRSTADGSDVDQQLSTVNLTRKLEEMASERKGLQLLWKILSQVDPNMQNERKRACQFNLGGHCSTENAAFLADRWHYLDSPLSPGRKKSVRTSERNRNMDDAKLLSDNTHQL